MPADPLTPALIFLFGGAGCLARYAITLATKRAFPDFPAGTLAANILGCLIIGLLAPALFAPHSPIAPRWRAAILIGFLGGFTTFSSFAYDTLALAHEHRWAAAAANFILNNALGLAAVAAGAWLATSLTTRTPA